MTCGKGNGVLEADATDPSSGWDDLSVYRRESGWLGRELTYYAVTGSTNEEALAAASSGAPEGLVVVADAQTAGRGRLARRWEAPPRSSLLVSCLFRPPSRFSLCASRVVMLCGLGIQAAVTAVCGLQTKLKWPNDLIFEPTEGAPGWVKLAGMLSEGVLAETGTTALVVGVGLNVNIPVARLAGLAPNAGSLSALTGGYVSRVALLDAFLCEVERGYDAWLAGDDPLKAWRRHLAWMGSPVVVTCGGTVVRGTLAGVDDDGRLLLRRTDGEMRTFSAGDVSLRPRCASSG